MCCQAKLGEEMLDYKDLAALPKTKAIYNIDRPDMLSYSPYVSYPSEERHYVEVSQPHLDFPSNTMSKLSHIYCTRKDSGSTSTIKSK